MAYNIGLDLGTSAIKGVLLGPDRDIVAVARRATEISRPAPALVEMDSDRFFELLCETVRELSGKAGREGVATIALSGATGNTLLLGENDRPLRPAIHWMDTRCAEDPACDMPGMDAESVRRVSGWPGFRGFPPAHLAWLRMHEPINFGCAARVGMNISYQYLRLCGVWALDHSTATTFYLQDQVSCGYYEPYLKWLELDRGKLPSLHASGTRIGFLTADAAGMTGLSEKTAVVLGSFDHPSAARGTGVLKPGDLLLSCGTSWVGFYPIPDRELGLSQKLLVDPFLSPSGPWGAMFSLSKVGDEVQSFVDQSFAHETSQKGRYALFNRAAQDAGSGSGNPSRALMERIANDMAARIRSLACAGLPAHRIVMVGGPTESPVWPDILRIATGLEITIPENGAYAGALGAAIMASTAK